MQINSLLSRTFDVPAPARSPEPTEVAFPRSPEEPLAASSSSARAARKVREILSRYDVTEISPRKFSEMLQALRQAGAITQSQFKELSLIRLDLDAAGVDPDEELDLVGFCEERLRKAQQAVGDEASGEQPASIAALERRLEWLRKIAMIQSAEGAPQFDSLA